LLAIASAGAARAPAQTSASVGVGVGTVRTEGGASFSSASLSPAVQYTTPAFLVAASGFAASLPAGVWAGHARLYSRASTPRLTGRWRLAAEGILTGTSWSSGGWTAAAHGLGELFWSAPKWGFGIGAGPSTGWIGGDSTRFVALHTRARAWWRPGGRAGATDWQLSVEPTRLIGEWFTDVSADFILERGPAVLSLSTDARFLPTYAYSAGSAFLQWYVAPPVAVEVGGGSYLREPYQGFPRGGFFTLGVRVGSGPSSRPATAKKWPALVPERRGDSLVVRFRFSGVRTVAIAGDWNGWQADPLRPLGGDVWEGTLALTRGLHHFNLLVDGRDWVVPNGVATVSDGLGGMVGVLLVRE
jgi:hypothetical protein